MKGAADRQTEEGIIHEPERGYSFFTASLFPTFAF